MPVKAARSKASAIPDSVTRWAGSLWMSNIVAALVVILVIAGGVSRFDHWWLAVVHSLGALVSVLMLFLLQHSTNRETTAILVKLDELIQATTGAREEVIDLEDREVEDQQVLHEQLHHGEGSADTH